METGMERYAALRSELRKFHGENGGQVCIDADRLARTARRVEAMERFAAEHPEADVWTLRRRIYELLREDFSPIIFPDSPFYCEMGGNGGWNHSGIGYWLYKHKRFPVLKDPRPEEWALFKERQAQHFYLCCGPFFDEGHDSNPYKNVLAKGFRGILEEARQALGKCRTDGERAFVGTAIAGLETVRVILDRYGEEARRMLDAPGLTDDQRRCLTRIAGSAPVAPWEPPRTFYEALNAVWFVRELIGELDGLAVNSLGRPDAWLIDYYRADLASGRLTEDEAHDLVCRFLLLGDSVYDRDSKVVKYGDHEHEIAMTLGGCDESGNEVFNELTRLFLQVHRELNLIYPKPHCRYSENSSREYLRLVTDDIAKGRGVYSLLNDGTIIPALVKSGKTLEDARDYSCTGCWDLVVDGREDNSGGNYFSLARILEATIHDPDENLAALKYDFARLDGSRSFDEVFDRLTGNALAVFRELLDAQSRYGRLRVEVAPTPLFSACSSDCLENRRDFTQGGQRYNPHAVSLCFFANYVDSLLAIRDLCFERKVCSLDELLAAVRGNWQGAETLRYEVLKAPHWGDDRPETRELARRIFETFLAESQKFRNARGGEYQLGMWIYREFRFWGEKTRALPDGRRDGDHLALSLGPSHFRNDGQITDMLKCLASLDLTRCAGNTVVNVVLDRSVVTPDAAEALVRTCGTLGLELLHLNCFSREDLLDAQKSPEKYPALMVRICGFSAKFTSLSPEWQDEVIKRTRWA